jgi:RNA polymerase sigma factor (sigma-70 family)
MSKGPAAENSPIQPSKGNMEAFREQIKLYLRPLNTYARRRLAYYQALGVIRPGEVRPEEMVDEAIARAMDRVSREGIPDRPLYPWLRRLVSDVIRSHAAKLGESARLEVSLFEEVAPGGLAAVDLSEEEALRLIDIVADPTAEQPLQVAERKEMLRVALESLARLPDAWREALLLHALDDYPLTQIAEMEGLPVREVERNIDAAQRFLRTMLREYLA